MDTIQSQVDYARSQPWFSAWIDALHLCEPDASGDTVIDIFYWKNTDEGHHYWQAINIDLLESCSYNEDDDLELADLKPYLPDYPEIFL